MTTVTKSLPALDVEVAVRRSREIDALLTSLSAERKRMDAQVIQAVGVGNAIEVDGKVTRVKQSSGLLNVSIEAVEAARQAGDISRRVFNTVTKRVVDMPLVRSLREHGRLDPTIDALCTVGEPSAAYVAHI